MKEFYSYTLFFYQVMVKLISLGRTWLCKIYRKGSYSTYKYPQKIKKAGRSLKKYLISSRLSVGRR